MENKLLDHLSEIESHLNASILVTTKEIVSDSNSLPVDISEVVWRFAEPSGNDIRRLIDACRVMQNTLIQMSSVVPREGVYPEELNAIKSYSDAASKTLAAAEKIFEETKNG